MTGVLTGAALAIGAAIARRFAGDGARADAIDLDRDGATVWPN